MKRFKFQQKLFLLAFLVAAPLLVVLGWEFLFVRAPRELGHAPEELAAVEIQASLLKVIHELQLYRDLGHGVANTNTALKPLFDERPPRRATGRQAGEPGHQPRRRSGGRASRVEVIAVAD